MKTMLLAALCAAAVLFPRASRAQDADVVIAAHDVLAVTVFGQADLSGKFTVAGDGTLEFPLIGRVTAAGLSPHALEEQIQSKLAVRYFKNPQVSVTLDQAHVQHVNVVGEVRQAGSYAFSGDVTLMDALARAGSTTDRAGAVALITRAQHNATDGHARVGRPDPATTVKVDLKRLQSGALEDNLPLHDGDTVFVPRADIFYVSGYVHNPGSFPLLEQTTVLQAIALAGGLTDNGSDRRVQIIRVTDGRRKTLKAKTDDLLQPGDTVVVRERLF